MFSKIEWIIAKRYLKTKRKESFITIISWLSLIGITLGVAVLIIVMSVMNGFKKELINSIVGIDGHLSISNLSYSYLQDYKRLSLEISKIKDVAHVGATISTQALVSTKYYSSGVLVKALTIPDILSRNILLNKFTPSAIKQFEEGEKVVFMGSALARAMGIDTLGPAKVVFPEFNSTVVGSIPKYITLNVVGTFKTGMFQYDNNMIIMPLNIAQMVFQTKGVQTLEVFIKNPENVNKVKINIVSNIPQDLFISTWQENNITLITALNTERNVMFIILFLIIMVAVFNIMSGLTMLVRSKTKEIAILKAMGFNNKNIRNIFLLIGLRTGIIGTTIGVILGVLFSLNIQHIKDFIENILHINVFNESVYFLSKLPAEVSFSEIIIIAGFSIFLSVLASIYPARKASKVIVAKALHYE